MTHPVDLVFQSLTHIVEPFMGESVSIPQKCSCCQRDPDEFGHAGFLMVNGYGENVAHCRSCQTFFVSAPELMGVENPKKPTTGQKFGMWSGVGAVINLENNSAVLLAPQGVVNKLPTHF
ncbi:hypothetical protein FJ701_10900, partial [Klebsiella pneumoniae]